LCAAPVLKSKRLRNPLHSFLGGRQEDTYDTHEMIWTKEVSVLGSTVDEGRRELYFLVCCGTWRPIHPAPLLRPLCCSCRYRCFLPHRARLGLGDVSCGLPGTLNRCSTRTLWEFAEMHGTDSGNGVRAGQMLLCEGHSMSRFSDLRRGSFLGMVARSPVPALKAPLIPPLSLTCCFAQCCVRRPWSSRYCAD